MNRENRATRAIWLMPVALALALVALPGLAGASPVTPATIALGGTSTQWAYGAQENVSFSVSANGNTYAFSGTYGLHVIVTRTNTSNTSYTLEVERTMGFHITANVTTPNATVSFTAKAWEQATGFVNVTDAGTVYENGTAVPAVAIQNASTQLSASLSENAQVTASYLGHTLTASASFDASLAGHASIQFTPAIGLVPLHVSNGNSWNSSAAYVLSGGASGKYTLSRTGVTGTTVTNSGNLSSTLSNSGTISLSGQDIGRITLSNGQTWPVIVIVATGPLHLEEGLLWVPAGADLWGDTQSTLHSQAVASVDTATDRIDAIVDVHGRLTVGASLTHLTSTPGSTAVGLAQFGTVAAVGTPPPGGSTGGAQIQTQPESVQQARSASQCLVTGCPGSSTGFLSSRLGLIVVGAAIIGVVALLAALVAGRRRAVHPPTGPASAFPAGVLGAQPPAPPVRNGTTTSPPKETEQSDPLGHLY